MLERQRSALTAKLERLVQRATADQRRELSSLAEAVAAIRADVEHQRYVLEELKNGYRESKIITAENNDARASADEALHGLVQSRSDELAGSLAAVREIAAGTFDDLGPLRRRLIAARVTDAYKDAMEEREPLVTVRMATYNRAGLLLERSLPSVLSQTYEHLEVVIVGDGCDDDTGKQLAALGDPRLRYVNLPYHGPYPEDPVRRWMVAGGTAMNLAAELAAGAWIAPLDDDDEYVPSHVERLVETAQGGGFELVYGRVRAVHAELDAPVEIGSYPPELGEISFNAAMYLGALRFYEYDPKAWVLEEPADWTLCRRMIATGVRIGFADEVLTVIRQAGPRWSGDDPAGKR